MNDIGHSLSISLSLYISISLPISQQQAPRRQAFVSSKFKRSEQQQQVPVGVSLSLPTRQTCQCVSGRRVSNPSSSSTCHFKPFIHRNKDTAKPTVTPPPHTVSRGMNRSKTFRHDRHTQTHTHRHTHTDTYTHTHTHTQ